MKVLVTGSSGQIGGAVLHQAPAGVRCIAPNRSALDLSDQASIEAYLEREKPELVINSGAYTDVEGAEENERTAMQVNAEAPGIFADWFAKNGGKLIQLSSDYVFDGKASQPYRPDDKRAPLSIYGRSKALGEDAAGKHAIILRTSWVYAAGGRNFVRTMLARMREGGAIHVVSDQTGSPSWAHVIARTVWQLAEVDGSGIFHHCDGGSTTWHEFAIAIAKEAQELGLIDKAPAIVPISSVDYPTKSARPGYSVLDDRKTRELLGDRVLHWRVNLRAMLEEERERG